MAATENDGDLRSEAKRRLRVVDLMISGHSMLRDRRARKAWSVRMAILIAASCQLAVAFVPQAVLASWGVPEERIPVALGVFALVLFVASLIEALSSWAAEASRHQFAVQVLSELKGELRAQLARPDSNKWKSEWKALDSRSNQAMAALPEIPERDFLSAKAHHTRKVAASRLLDTHPGVPVWILRLSVRVRSTTSLLRDDHEADA